MRAKQVGHAVARLQFVPPGSRKCCAVEPGRLGSLCRNCAVIAQFGWTASCLALCFTAPYSALLCCSLDIARYNMFKTNQPYDLNTKGLRSAPWNNAVTWGRCSDV